METQTEEQQKAINKAREIYNKMSKQEKKDFFNSCFTYED